MSCWRTQRHNDCLATLGRVRASHGVNDYEGCVRGVKGARRGLHTHVEVLGVDWLATWDG